jgi:hypothetical protein
MLYTTPVVAQLIGEEPWFAAAPKQGIYDEFNYIFKPEIPFGQMVFRRNFRDIHIPFARPIKFPRIAGVDSQSNMPHLKKSLQGMRRSVFFGGQPSIFQAIIGEKVLSTNSPGDAKIHLTIFPFASLYPHPLI